MPSSRTCSELALVVALAGCAPDAFVEVHAFGDDPGALRMFERVPDVDVDGPRDLLVFLHGCNQSHDAARTTGFAERAAERGVLVVAPEQGAFNNGSACFNWFERGDTARDDGEAASIASMIAHAKDEHAIDGRVFVAGLSAGAVMATSLLAAYPDVFAAGASFAGGPVGCAESVVDAAGCMTASVERDGDAWAALARARAPDGDERTTWPRLLVVHGAEDSVVAPANADALVAQWTALAGEGAVELELVDGLDHAMSIDVDDGCGVDAPFQRDLDRCMADEALAFFAGR